MQDPVQHRVGQGAVPEGLAPTVEALVAREYRRTLPMAHRDELEEQVAAPSVDGEEPPPRS